MEAKVKAKIMSFLKNVVFVSSSFRLCSCLLGHPKKLLLIYDAPKFSTVYVVKWQIISN